MFTTKPHWKCETSPLNSYRRIPKAESQRRDVYGKKMQQTAAFEGISSYIRNYFFDDNQAERNPITKLTCGLFELDDF